jgi:hypothetical protein
MSGRREGSGDSTARARQTARRRAPDCSGLGWAFFTAVPLLSLHEPSSNTYMRVCRRCGQVEGAGERAGWIGTVDTLSLRRLVIRFVKASCMSLNQVGCRRTGFPPAALLLSGAAVASHLAAPPAAHTTCGSAQSRYTREARMDCNNTHIHTCSSMITSPAAQRCPHDLEPTAAATSVSPAAAAAAAATLCCPSPSPSPAAPASACPSTAAAAGCCSCPCCCSCKATGGMGMLAGGRMICSATCLVVRLSCAAELVCDTERGRVGWGGQ